MQHLLLIETPETAFRRVLVERFNAGFLAAGAEFPRCSPESRAAAHDAAERGKGLADRLTGTAGLR
jgi:predicted secreted protein